MKDVIADEEETVKVNSSLQHENEPLKKQIHEEKDEKIAEDKMNEKCTSEQDPKEQSNAQSPSEENIEINVIIFNDATNNKTDKEILVDGTENINDPKGNALTVLPQEMNGVSTGTDEKEISEVRPTEEKTNEDKLCELTSVIEISEDGTWDTAELPADNVEQIKSKNIQCNENKNISSDFLTSNFVGSDIANKQASAHGAQYYINSSVENMKPIKDEKDLVHSEYQSEKARNIGAQIMEKYDEERQKIKDSKNLPDVSLLDVEESLEDIERERRKIIESQAVRAKRIDSWIKGGSVVSSMELEKMDLIDDQKDRDQQRIDTSNIEYSWEQNSLVTQLMNYTADGEVVYDSILENKQKTKTFWEQLMLAANLSADSPPTSLSKADHQVHSSIIDKKLQNDTSDQEFYDAQPYSNIHTPPEVIERIDSPKIVDVSKKMADSVDSKIITHNSNDDSNVAVETEVKANSVKEYGSNDERERNLQQKLKSQAESKIVLEMREMKEREDEWRRNQMAFQTSLSSVGTVSSFKEDEAFISIPTTDEGNYSEYGSEEKEERSLNGINRMISPDVSVSQNVPSIGFHQRTQSLDSMSSGHSSGSGSVTQIEHVPTVNRSSRRGITVKPLDEPEDDDISTFIWREKETPIEREIRLACEREEELKREKSASLSIKDSPPPVPQKELLTPADEKNTAETPKRLATKRIENEIELAKKREKELKKGHIEEETQPIKEVSETSNTFSDATKPNLKNNSIKNETPILRQNKIPPLNGKILNINITTPPTLETKEVAKNIQNKLHSSNNNVEVMPKRFQPNPHQKGLMKRFLASRGKISSGFAFSTNNVESSCSPITPNPHPVTTDMFFSSKVSKVSLENNYDKTENSTLGSRPGYTSAEDKIQFELMEMRKREDELRRERARLLARSQPDLLSLVDDEKQREIKAEEENYHDSENPNKLPPMAKLRSALSNPSLLDIDKQLPVQRKQQRRSALIEEWEDRIQKSHSNE